MTKKKPKLGTGKRFANLVKQLMAKGYSKEKARRIAAYIGLKKYGKRMQKWAAKQRAKK